VKPMLIREYQDHDAAALRRCVVVLQDFERRIDTRILPGEIMADRYCEQIHARCRASVGRVYIADVESEVAGFVAVLARQPFTELDEPPGYHALITDLVVLEPYRGRGVGRRLLEQAESYAREAGATELRIGVLASNHSARKLYLGTGFLPHVEILTKRW